MLSLDWVPFAWLGLAIVLEVIANLLLKYSDGFRRRALGVTSILCVLGAFSALAQAVKDIELSVAYAVWGGFGILATVAMGWALFGQRLVWRGWLGLGLLVAGMSRQGPADVVGCWAGAVGSRRRPRRRHRHADGRAVSRDIVTR